MHPVLYLIVMILCISCGLILVFCLNEYILRSIRARKQARLWNNGISPYSGKKWIRVKSLFDSEKRRVYCDDSGNRLTVTESSVDGIHIN